MEGNIQRVAQSERKSERENCVGAGGRFPHVLETSECSVGLMPYALTVPEEVIDMLDVCILLRAPETVLKQRRQNRQWYSAGTDVHMSENLDVTYDIPFPNQFLFCAHRPIKSRGSFCLA